MTPQEAADDRRPVVVGIDGSQGSARALDWAVREAVDRQAPLRIVTAWSWDSTVAGSPSTRLERQARQTQDALVRAVLARFAGPLPVWTADLVQADAASALIERSADGALLVLGSRGTSGVADVVVGSVADACLRHGSCPVVVIPAGPAVELPEQTRTPGRRPGLAPVVLAALGLL